MICPKCGFKASGDGVRGPGQRLARCGVCKGTRLEVPDLESSISGHLSWEDEATELSGQLVDDYAWVDKNGQKTGWRNPEAAKWKARQDPEGFAKERRAYEAGWTIVEHKRTCGGSAP